MDRNKPSLPVTQAVGASTQPENIVGEPQDGIPNEHHVPAGTFGNNQRQMYPDDWQMLKDFVNPQSE